jgi:DME family drug/metabolite transporter
VTPHEGSTPTVEDDLPDMPTAAAPARAPDSATRGFVLVVAAALCWGTSGISGDVVARRSDLAPLEIAWYRMAIGAVVLLAVHLLTRRRRAGRRVPLTRATAGQLTVVAVGLAAYQAAYFAAVATAGVSIATLVALGLAPLLVALASAALGHGRPDRATLVALGVALAGLVLLVGTSAGADTGDTVVLGALVAVGCAVAYGAVVVSSGLVTGGVPTTMVGFIGGALLLTPVVLATGLHLPGDPVALGVLAYLGVVPSALAYGLFFTGVRTVPASVAAIVTLLEPLTATMLATAFLGERLAPAALAGGMLMLAAVAGLYLRRMGDSNSRGLAPNPLSKRAP